LLFFFAAFLAGAFLAAFFAVAMLHLEVCSRSCDRCAL
jgi:hypothetical protein